MVTTFVQTAGPALTVPTDSTALAAKDSEVTNVNLTFARGRSRAPTRAVVSSNLPRRFSVFVGRVDASRHLSSHRRVTSVSHTVKRDHIYYSNFANVYTIFLMGPS